MNADKWFLTGCCVLGLVAILSVCAGLWWYGVPSG